MYKFKVYFYIKPKYQPKQSLTVDVTANNFCDAQNKALKVIKAKYYTSPFGVFGPPFNIWQITKLAKVTKGPKALPEGTKIVRRKCTDLPALQYTVMKMRIALNVAIDQYNKAIYENVSKSKLAELATMLEYQNKNYSRYLMILKQLEVRCKKQPAKPELEERVLTSLFEE